MAGNLSMAPPFEASPGGSEDSAPGDDVGRADRAAGDSGAKSTAEWRIVSAVRRLGAWLGWIFKNLPSVAIAIAIATAFAYAVYNRGAVHLLPFKPDDAGLALQLGRALDDVAKGAQTGVNLDASLRCAVSGGPPPVTLPGTNVSIEALFGLFQWGALRETEIRAVLSNEKDDRGRDAYRMRLQVDGPTVSVHAIETDVRPTPEQADLDGAALLYEVLEPAAAAYYLFSRDPNRALDVVGRILHGESSHMIDRVSAYHVWGLVLRDEGDYDGAREKLQLALDENENLRVAWLHLRRPERERKARIYVDIGYVDRLDGQWRSAAEAFGKAALADPTWGVPLTLRADMLSTLGAFSDAATVYTEAIRVDPSSPDSWHGLGLVDQARGENAKAVEDFLKARRLGLSRTQQASLSGQLAELLSGLGCSQEAGIEWDRAVHLNAAEGDRRPDWQEARACKVPRQRDEMAPAPPRLTPATLRVAADGNACRWLTY